MIQVLPFELLNVTTRMVNIKAILMTWCVIERLIVKCSNNVVW